MPEVNRSETGIGRLELEVTVSVARERAWQAFVEETSDWWPEDFYTGPTERFVLEPKVGGRLYEDQGDGAGVLWYTIIGFRPPASLDLAGNLTAEFGGPCSTQLRVQFEEGEEGTVLKVTDHVVGRVGEDQLEQLHSGWTYLFTEGFKRYVEQD